MLIRSGRLQPQQNLVTGRADLRGQVHRTAQTPTSEESYAGSELYSNLPAPAGNLQAGFREASVLPLETGDSPESCARQIYSDVRGRRTPATSATRS